MDVATLREVFVLGEYDWDLEYEPRVIFDLGAHCGDTALYYNARYPDATIVAVEPAPDNFKRLQQNTAGIQNIVTINAAVGAVDGTVVLHLGEADFGHSYIQRSDESTSVEVSQYTIQTLCNMAGVSSIDLCKFDIEGAEFPLLESIDISAMARSYIGELHFDLNDTWSHDTFYELVQPKQLQLDHIVGERYIVRF